MAASNSPRRARAGTGSSIRSTAQSIKNVTERIIDADVPLGGWSGIANASAQAPTLGDIRRGSFGHSGWDENYHREKRLGSVASSMSDGRPGGNRRTSSGRMPRRTSTGLSSEPHPDIQEEGSHQPGTSGSDNFATLHEEPTQLSHDNNASRQNDIEPFPQVNGEDMSYNNTAPEGRGRDQNRKIGAIKQPSTSIERASTLEEEEIPTGYIVPPKKPWKEASWIGFKAFMRWVFTPFGFLITIYALNVVAWGGMLFLVELGGAPKMCNKNTAENHYDGCNDLQSPRKKWLEIDSQILTALFCVTAFGLIPWRFRDFYWLLRYRLCNENKKGRQAKMIGKRRLAGIHANWYRLPGSDTLDELTPAAYEAARLDGTVYKKVTESADGSQHSPAQMTYTNTSYNLEEASTGLQALPENDERIPLPVGKRPLDPLTGVRAPPTPFWKMELMIWCMVWNTFLQVALCGLMWGMNRYERPGGAVAAIIVIACMIAGYGGWLTFAEGNKVKRVEGMSPKTIQNLEDAEGGIEMQKEDQNYDSRHRDINGVNRVNGSDFSDVQYNKDGKAKETRA